MGRVSGPQNPGGYMGAGVVIHETNEEPHYIHKGYKKDGSNSNNKAEYLALEIALDKLRYEHDKDVFIYGDSNLVIQQMSGKWKIKGGMYSEIAFRCQSKLEWLLQNQELQITFKWIPREKNTVADELSKHGIQEAISKL